MDTVQINARPRHLAGTDVARKIRRAGLLPAVLYGNGTSTRSIAVDPAVMRRALQSKYGRNQLFEVALDGGTHLAISKEVQVHPVSRALEHVDLYVVRPDSAIEVTLPVVLSGRSAGQKAGGRLEQVTRYVKVACTPATLPHTVAIDVTPFENGFTMMVEDLPLPAGVTPVYKKTFKILEVIAPKVEEKPVVEEKKKK